MICLHIPRNWTRCCCSL